MLTGEPNPVAKAAGDGVIGASINRSSACPCALGLATPSSTSEQLRGAADLCRFPAQPGSTPGGFDQH
jgi:cation transport ATPase